VEILQAYHVVPFEGTEQAGNLILEQAPLGSELLSLKHNPLVLLGELAEVARCVPGHRILKALRRAGRRHQHLRNGGGENLLAELVRRSFAIERGIGDEHHVQVREDPNAPARIGIDPPRDSDRRHPDAHPEMEDFWRLVPHARCPAHILVEPAGEVELRQCRKSGFR
jgi:hypothetical protein